VFSFQPQLPQQQLFNFVGFNVARCVKDSKVSGQGGGGGGSEAAYRHPLPARQRALQRVHECGIR
jgi:hypothetical protein